MPNNTKITNSADIYFDYNAPVTTNQTMHTVNDQVQASIVTKVIPQGNKVSEILIYPNPATDDLFIEFSNLQPQASIFQKYRIYGLEGKKVKEGNLDGAKTRISTKDLESGVYFLEVIKEESKVVSKLVITR